MSPSDAALYAGLGLWGFVVAGLVVRAFLARRRAKPGGSTLTLSPRSPPVPDPAAELARRTALEWKEAQALLPAGWGPVAPGTGPQPAALRRVEGPYAEALVRGIANVAPAARTALLGPHLFRMVGPPAALDGLANGTLQFQIDKGGQQLMSLVPAGSNGGPYRANARVEGVAEAAKGAAVAACVFQVLSVVTAQYYLHQITTQLSAISVKLDEVLGRLDDQRYGRFRAAAVVVEQVEQTTLRALGRGTLPQQLDASAEFWARMANAESDLRAVMAEYEGEYQRVRPGWLQSLGLLDPDAQVYNRRPVIMKDETPELLNIASTATRIATGYSACLCALIRWHQVALAHDALTNSSRLEGRYLAMRGDVEQAARFMGRLTADRGFFLGKVGDHWFDTTKDVAACLSAILIYPLYRAERTEKENQEARAALSNALYGVDQLAAPARLAAAALTADRPVTEFYLRNRGTLDAPEVEVLMVEASR